MSVVMEKLELLIPTGKLLPENQIQLIFGDLVPQLVHLGEANIPKIQPAKMTQAKRLNI